MFFETYKKLCEEHGEKPYSLPVKLGAKSNSIVAQWKNGSLPRPEMLQRIADYFEVSVGHLIDGEEKKEKPTGDNASGLLQTKYSMLNPENKIVIDLLIERLLASQSDQ